MQRRGNVFLPMLQNQRTSSLSSQTRTRPKPLIVKTSANLPMLHHHPSRLVVQRVQSRARMMLRSVPRLAELLSQCALMWLWSQSWIFLPRRITRRTKRKGLPLPGLASLLLRLAPRHQESVPPRELVLDEGAKRHLLLLGVVRARARAAKERERPASLRSKASMTIKLPKEVDHTTTLCAGLSSSLAEEGSTCGPHCQGQVTEITEIIPILLLPITHIRHLIVHLEKESKWL